MSKNILYIIAIPELLNVDTSMFHILYSEDNETINLTDK